jgi:hypothetical protein
MLSQHRKTLRRRLCIFLLVQTLPCSNGWSSLKRLASASRIAYPDPSLGNNKIRNGLKRIAPFRSTSKDNDLSEVDIPLLLSENNLLRETIRQLEEDNLRLKQKAQTIVLENFEGERFFRDEKDTLFVDPGDFTSTGEGDGQDELWCDALDGGESTISCVG